MRVLLVLLMALGLVLGSLVAPAAAGSDEGGSDDLETVRSETLSTIDYKIKLLTNLKEGTDKPEAGRIYDEGIAELRELRGHAEASNSVEDLRAMNSKAHSIYHATKNRASTAGKTDAELLEDARKATLGTIDYKLGYFRDKKAKTDDAGHRAIYAAAIGQLEALRSKAETSTSIDKLRVLKSEAHSIYNATKKRVKESGADKIAEKTEAEKAAEALAAARRSTLRLIEHKAAIFTHAAEAAKNPVVAGVYLGAAASITELVADAKAAKTKKALRAIDAQVMEIYEAAKEAIKGSHGKPEWQPSESMLAHIEALGSAISRLVAVAEVTADQSPETATAVVKAGAKVTAAIEAVAKVTETGKRLGGKWQDLREAIHDFRKAFAAHVVAITGAPGCVNGWHLPG